MIFKVIPIAEDYSISECGTCVKNNKRNKFVAIQKHSSYNKVQLRVKGKRINFYVHRIVASAFLKIPKKYSHLDFKDLVVHHKNHIKKDNHRNNLEYTCHSNNAKAHKSYKKEKVVDVNRQILAGVLK